MKDLEIKKVPVELNKYTSTKSCKSTNPDNPDSDKKKIDFFKL